MGTFSHGIGGDGAGKVPLEKDSVLKTLILEKIVPPKRKDNMCTSNLQPDIVWCASGLVVDKHVLSMGYMPWMHIQVFPVGGLTRYKPPQLLAFGSRCHSECFKQARFLQPRPPKKEINYCVFP